MTGHLLSRPSGCRCHSSCEFPCWQRVGWADPCGACGCATVPDTRGRVAAGVDMERCGACAELITTGAPCPACGWARA
jgi:hypothetical protein